MIGERVQHVLLAPGFALLAGVVLTGAVAAQAPDFLFKRPTVTLGVKVGYAVPRANSEIFDFTREQLTVDKSDFNAWSLAGELGVRATDRIDVALGVGGEWSSTRSEFREFVGTDDLPIEQDTRLTRVPVTLGVKAYLLGRGRRISELAWIPSKWAPYVGGGGGFAWYRFQQVGEFVDFDTLDIFFDDFESMGVAPLAYLTAGMDFSLGPRWFLNGETRYSWASAGMDRDFVDFDDIDLAGFRGTVGMSVRF
ncbi:MAG: hypothetical protein ACC682_01710 [Gemmatimonadota bacterium]